MCQVFYFFTEQSRKKRRELIRGYGSSTLLYLVVSYNPYPYIGCAGGYTRGFYQFFGQAMADIMSTTYGVFLPPVCVWNYYYLSMPDVSFLGFLRVDTVFGNPCKIRLFCKKVGRGDKARGARRRDGETRPKYKLFLKNRHFVVKSWFFDGFFLPNCLTLPTELLQFRRPMRNR